MKTEVLCNEVTFNDILKCIFESSSKRIDTICIPSGCLKNIDDDFIRHHCSFASIIDFPLGISDTQLRLHEIALSLRRGVLCIDLVINTHDLESGNLASIRKDFIRCASICKAAGALIRPILEYRTSDDETLFNVSQLLLDHGSFEIIVGTGSMVDDLSDNIIISKLIEQKLAANVISCGPILCQDHYDLYQSSKISGIRIKSFKILDNLCIKY